MPRSPSGRIAQLRRFLVLLAQRFAADRLMQVAGSLSFTTLLSLVPLVTVALALMTRHPLFSHVTEALNGFLTQNLLPEKAGGVVARYVLQFSHKADRLTQIGSALLPVTAVMTLLTIDHAFNTIWRVRRFRPLWSRIVVYTLALALGPLLLGAGFAVVAYAVSASLGLVNEPKWVAVLLFRAVSVSFLFALLALLYFAVPNTRVRARDAALGAAFAALAFVLMQRLFALFVTGFPTYNVIYGAFAVVPIFLLWLFLSWSVVLAGALIAATLGEWRERGGSEVQPAHGLYVALRLLLGLGAGGRSEDALAQATGETPETLAQALAELELGGWIVPVGKGEWRLAPGVEVLPLTPLLCRLLLDPALLPQAQNEEEGQLQRRLLALRQELGQGAEPTLAQLAREPAPGLQD